MPETTPSPVEIGRNARTIRERRYLSQTVVAHRMGISQPYYSLLESGARTWYKRGLLENAALALGCSVIDLTGQPYLPGNHASAEALHILPDLSLALYDATLDDAPDVPARPIRALATMAATANEHTANSRYAKAGRYLGPLLTELHVHAARGRGSTRRRALEALVEACAVASGIARSLGNTDLAVAAARRGEQAAERLDSPALQGFAAMSSSTALSRAAARHRARSVVNDALNKLEPYADPSAPDTSAAEAWGMLHLSAAQMAAKDENAAEADSHLSIAKEFAERTGERNSLWFAFGPANVVAWELSGAVELGQGPETADRISLDEVLAALPTDDRRAALLFDIARAYVQAGGGRDLLALRYLDRADWIAPERLRADPVAHEVLRELDTRGMVSGWLLTSLKNRYAT